MIVLKHYSDLKSKLEVRKVKFASGAKMTIFGQLGFDTRQMLKLGQYGVFLIRDRASKGIGSDDQPMAPLTPGSARRKAKAGKGNRVNLTYSGDLLKSFSVRSVSATQARIDITSQKQRTKAGAIERGRAGKKGTKMIARPWWGFSARDMVKLAAAFQFVFKENMSIGVGGTAKGRAFGSGSIWMDPLQQKGDTVRMAA